MKKILVLILLFLFHCDNSDQLEPLYLVAKRHYLEGKLAESMKEFQKLEDVENNYKDSKLYIGKIYFFQGNFEKASKEFEEASSTEYLKLNSLAWKIKSDYASSVDRSIVLKQITQYLEIDNGNLEILFIQGKIHLDSGSIQEAITSFERILMYEDRLGYAHRELSNIFERAKIKEKAEYHQKKASTLLDKDIKKTVESPTEKNASKLSKTTRKSKN